MSKLELEDLNQLWMNELKKERTGEKTYEWVKNGVPLIKEEDSMLLQDKLKVLNCCLIPRNQNMTLKTILTHNVSKILSKFNISRVSFTRAGMTIYRTSHPQIQMLIANK